MICPKCRNPYTAMANIPICMCKTESMSTKPFQIYRIDPGFCRIIYKGKNRHNQNIYYGIYQESTTSFRIYRCCPQLEAQNIAHPKIQLSKLFEYPSGESQLEKDIAAFISDQSWYYSSWS